MANKRLTLLSFISDHWPTTDTYILDMFFGLVYLCTQLLFINTINSFVLFYHVISIFALVL